MLALVVGHYCPTDRNPETEADEALTAVACRSPGAVERWRLWYPDGAVVVVEPSGEG